MKGYEKYGRKVGLPYDTKEDKQELINNMAYSDTCPHDHGLKRIKKCLRVSCIDCITQSLETEYEK